MSELTKRILHLSGSALAIIGILFVAIRLNNYNSQIDLSHLDNFAWAIVSGLTLIYGLASIMLALAWWNLLVYFGAITSQLWAVKIYGLTQLAKYIPGNIMHLASRQAMGQAEDLPGWTLAKASFWELGLISIVGAFFSILVLPQFLPIVTVLIAAIAFVSILLFVVLGLNRYMGLAIARAFGWYIAFLLISSMVFVGVLVQLMNEDSINLSLVLVCGGAFVVAWLVGLVTPGAPAGIGVRELE